MLDVGCGNGKYLSHFQLDMTGLDYSSNLAELAQNQHQNAVLVTGDAMRLPFKEEQFDCVICIAMLHHLATRERRVQAISEMKRVLRPDGMALISVWAFE